MTHESTVRLLVVVVAVLLTLVFFHDGEFPSQFGKPLALRGETLSGSCTPEDGEGFARNVVHEYYGCGKEHYCWLAAWNRFLPGRVQTDFACVDYRGAQAFIDACQFALRQDCGPW